MSRRDPITIVRLSLKCDADGCAHEEELSQVSPKDIGKKCPKCGANLLSDDDYSAAVLSLSCIGIINASVGPVEREGELLGPSISINPRSGDDPFDVLQEALDKWAAST